MEKKKKCTGCVISQYDDQCTGGRGFAATPAPPATGEGATPEAAPIGPAGGALSEARFYGLSLYIAKKIRRLKTMFQMQHT